ncbi:MAG: fumarate reductase/succinate dehydrogenase flavoprotein subunit [Verrucomicrobiales bacterium]|nr:fumarate reductase/succinate dehydrogenase flavoprotein subunit [Verrucomicrobiales bacterium]
MITASEAAPASQYLTNADKTSDTPPDAVPSGPLHLKWSKHKATSKLINPANRRKYTVIVVGSGLAGAAAAATLSEQGYKVKCFCYQDSARRAHSIAAQGGINAAKNYQNDGDSVYRLFYDTIKGGDYRAREANVYRLAEVSAAIIDQCVAQGVPFAREYGGLLANRSFGGTQVSRTFYASGQTGQQLLLGAYSALSKEIARGGVQMFPRTEMLDLVVVDGHAKGIVVRDMVTGKISSHAGDTVLLCTGGYGNAFYLSTNAKGCNVTATWRAHKRGAWFANPCYTQIHPTCIPVSGSYQSKLTLMSESLRNDGRCWVPKRKEDCGKPPGEIADADRDYYLERKYPSYGNLAPRDIASRAAKEVCDEGRGVGPGGLGVYLDFSAAIKRYGMEALGIRSEAGIKNLSEVIARGEQAVKERYDNLFDMYQQITGENAFKVPMRIFPAVHYTMGGLWVDYNLQSNLTGLHVLGEANFSDHGANRLGASALMQGLADGYFVIPATLPNYLAGQKPGAVTESHAEFRRVEEEVQQRFNKLVSINGKRTVNSFHRELGLLLWDDCGMSRTRESLAHALQRIPELREEFWNNVRVPGSGASFNQQLEMAGRVADFFEFGELLCLDAQHREESAGGHFRSEHQVEGEARRNDEDFSYAAAWEYTGDLSAPSLHREWLKYEEVSFATRSYK